MSKTVLCRCGERVRVGSKSAARSVQCPACGKLVVVRRRRGGASARPSRTTESSRSAKASARARSARVRGVRPSQAPLFIGALAVGVLLIVAIVYVARSRGREGQGRTRRGAEPQAGVQNPVRASYADRDVRRLVRQLHAGKLRARTAAARALVAMGPRACEAVPDLLVAMGRKSAGIEFEVAVGRAFKAMGSAAVPELLGALRSGSAKTRFYAARALMKVGPRAKGAVDALVAVLERDADYSVRSSAAAALGAMGPAASKALPALKRAAGNPNAPITHDTARGELRVRAQLAIDQIQSRLVK